MQHLLIDTTSKYQTKKNRKHTIVTVQQEAVLSKEFSWHDITAPILLRAEGEPRASGG